jgi:hypothetical protein
MSRIKPQSCLIALALLGAHIDIAEAQKKKKPQASQRNCYAEAEQRCPDPTSPNTARCRQMWVYACWQGVKP